MASIQTMALYIAVMVCAVGPLTGQRVVARAGDVFYAEAGGSERQLTTSGQNDEPRLSPSGKLVVFVHRTGKIAMLDRVRRDPESQLWVADSSGERPPDLILSSPVEVNGRKFNGFFSPSFAANDADIYFLVSYAPTTSALVRLSATDHSLRFVALAIDYQIIATGDYTGDLIVRQRRPYANGGFYLWYWLLDKDGKDLGLIGPNEDAVRNFLATTAR